MKDEAQLQLILLIPLSLNFVNKLYKNIKLNKIKLLDDDYNSTLRDNDDGQHVNNANQQNFINSNFNLSLIYYKLENDIILNQLLKYKNLKGHRFYNRLLSLIEFTICLVILMSLSFNYTHILTYLPNFLYWLHLSYLSLKSLIKSYDEFSFEKLILSSIYLVYNLLSFYFSFDNFSNQFILSLSSTIIFISLSLFSPYQTNNVSNNISLDKDQPDCLEEPKSLFSRFWFLHLDNFIHKHFKNSLNKLSEIPSLRSDNLTTFNLLKFRSTSNSPPTTSTFIPRLFLTFKFDLMYMVIMSTFKSLFTFSAPFFLEKILHHISNRKSNDNDYQPYIYALALFFGQVLSSLFNQQALLVGRKLCINLRSILISEIFLKSLRKKFDSNNNDNKDNNNNTESNESSSIGIITNLVSVDSFKVGDITAYLHFVFPECPLTIILAIFGLYRLLGYSALIGVSVLVLTMPLTYFVNGLFVKYQKQLLAAIDVRLDATTEVLSNISIIKISGWSDRFFKLLGESRSKELMILKKRFGIWSLNAVLMWGSPVLVMICTFTAHTKLFNNPLLSQEAFTALLLFSILRSPLEALPEVIIHVLQGRVSCIRIADYLSKENDTSKYQQLSGPKEVGDPVIGFRNATLTYQNNNFRLSNLNLDFPIGKFSVIAGPVGSGKSSLLDSLLGELNLLNGRVFMPCAMNSDEIPLDPILNLKESVAYCSQSPFLLSTSIKQNIVFGSHFNEDRYYHVLKCCSLLPDLELFDDGDETEVGEKGTACSGGQKARIALARAIYSQARHILLDDVLSAVDANTGQYLVENALLGPIMKDRTVLLVTHNVSLTAPRASYVVFLRDGIVDGAGTPQELVKEGLLEGISLEIDNVKKFDETEPTIIKKQQIEKVEDHDKRIESNNNGMVGMMSNDILVEGYATPNPNNQSQDSSKGISKKKTAIKEEQKSEGSVSFDVYKLYAYSLGGLLFHTIVFTLFISAQTADVGSSYLLRLWTSSFDNVKSNTFFIISKISFLFMNKDSLSITSDGDNDEFKDNTNFYLGLYIVVSFTYILLNAICMLIMFGGSIKASKYLYETMLRKVMGARSRFFDSTPTGRIMNRLSKDTEVVDQETAPVILWFIHSLVMALVILLVIIFAAPMFAFMAVFISIIYYIIGIVYLTTSRDVKRIESLTRSPIFSTFFECLSGVVTIRAYACGIEFQKKVYKYIDENNKSFLTLWLTNRWLSLRIDFAAALISLVTAVFLLLNKQISPSLAGFALSYAITFNEAVLWVVRLSAQTEINLNSVERIGEYLDLEQEQNENEGEQPSIEWPSENSYIDIRGISTRYSAEFRKVLDNVSFTVKPGEKIGICGRTGSGKSTLILCLNRILELESGFISIDGVDISTLKLQPLRERMTTIPQEAQLFAGKIRKNLDPFDQFEDDEIWDILKRVKLASNSSSTTSLPELSNNAGEDRLMIKSLDDKVDQNGKNFSAGQRQLLALARGLLKLSNAKSNILLLDESTANLDSQTDQIIQKALRYNMKNVTILCVAHRLRTIADYDKILVLEKGKVVEFDTPINLFNKDGHFRSLCRQSGEESELERIIFKT